MVQEETFQRLAKLEVKVEEHERKLLAQEEKNESQLELNTILKLQLEENKENRKQITKISETLEKINNSQEKLSSRVEDIESTLQDQKRTRTDIVKGISKYILTAIGGMIVAYFSIKLGLK